VDIIKKLIKKGKEYILKMLLRHKMDIKRNIEDKAGKANLLLIRDYFSDKSVMGKLYCNGEFISHTLELAWKDNQKSISCIPRGEYKCRVRLARESATRDYIHLLVENVKDRSYILFHRGNYPSDSKGCILTGTHRGIDADKILESKIAHTYLMNYLLENQLSENISLTIKNR